MNTIADDISESWNQTADLWENFSLNLKNARDAEKNSIDLDMEDDKESISYRDITRRLAECADYVGLVSASANIDVVPLRSLKRILALINELKVALVDPVEKFTKFEEAGGIGVVDNSQMMISSADDVIKIDIASLYRGFFDKLDNIAYEFSIVTHFFKSTDDSSFYSRRRKVDRIVSDTEAEAQKVRVTRERLEDTDKTLKSLVSQVNRSLDDIQEAEKTVTEASAAVQAKYSELDERSAQGAQTLQAVQQLIEKANALRTEVLSYDKFLADYKEKLIAVEGQVEGFKSQLNENLTSYAAQDDEIKRLSADAENMLTGATVAGLAGEFGKIKEKLETDLQDAKSAVHWSAFFLLVSVLPILAYVFGPAIGLNTNGVQFGEGNFVQSLTSLGMRAVLLIPATWFSRFSARRYDRIFRLKEHYAYKYSLATAVEGFKKQAPLYEDDIAAETFYELTFNPADRLEASKRSTERRESIVLKAIRDRIKEKNKDEPEGSN